MVDAVRIARRSGLVLGALFGVFLLGIVNYGWIDLADVLPFGSEGDEVRILAGAWGALFGIVLPMALLSQVIGAERRPAGIQQLAVVVACIILTGVLGLDGGYLLFGLVLGGLGAVLVYLHPAPEILPRRRGRIDIAFTVFSLLWLVPAFPYALDAAANLRAGEPPESAMSNSLHHWGALCALTIAIGALSLLAALKTPGWRLPGWSAALGAMTIGVASVAYPDSPGALDPLWGGAAAMWGLTMVMLSSRSDDRT